MVAATHNDRPPAHPCPISPPSCARPILIDTSGVAAGIADQLRVTAELFDVTNLTLVDVGGDVLTDGQGRNPLADQLALPACLRTGLPTCHGCQVNTSRMGARSTASWITAAHAESTTIL